MLTITITLLILNLSIIIIFPITAVLIKVRVRFCAAAVDTRFLAVIGGEMDGEVLDSMKTLDLETNEWRMQAQTLRVPRKDHACVSTRLDDEEGILVAGGVDTDNT